MSQETCTYCAAYNMQTLEPIGPNCGAPAVEILVWKDGRTSPACIDHGVEALDQRVVTELLAEARPL